MVNSRSNVMSSSAAAIVLQEKSAAVKKSAEIICFMIFLIFKPLVVRNDLASLQEALLRLAAVVCFAEQVARCACQQSL